jgi:hypothetical protein
MSLGYLSKQPFLNDKNSFAVDLTQSQVFQLRTCRRVEVKGNKTKPRQRARNDAPEFEILKISASVAGMIIIAPFVLLACIDDENCLK